ncbi:MAG TPA: hypothetical protein DGH68_06770 [Bacteroidetes bacterium]|nr:hypothetical protein [Bacteroidota bacterium]
MLLVVRRARRLQALATELAQNTGHDLSLRLAPFTVYNDPEAMADALRKQLGISSETQTSVWRNERQALAEWKSAIENLGIMILQIGMPLTEARGFSLVGDGIPVIVLNARDAQRAQAFSLFHECAHLALNNFGICDMRDGRKISAELTKIERFCNHFAGALLLPRQLVQNHPLVSGLRTVGRVPDETLMTLSDSFKVSQEVVLRRLVILGKASTEFYEAKRKEWQKDVKKQMGGRANPPKKCIRENGLPFVSLVFNAFREEKITYRDVADYLTIRAKHLPRVEQLIGEMAYSNEAAI